MSITEYRASRKRAREVRRLYVRMNDLPHSKTVPRRAARRMAAAPRIRRSLTVLNL